MKGPIEVNRARIEFEITIDTMLNSDLDMPRLLAHLLYLDHIEEMENK